MFLRSRFVRLALVAAASGCGSYVARPAAVAPYPGPNDEHGVVCVARASSAGTGEAVPVWDNGHLVGANPRSSHFCYRAAIGKHTLTSELLVTAELAIDVRPRAHVWVRQDVGASAYGPARSSVPRRRGEWVSLELVSEREGAAHLATTVRHELIEAPANERLPPQGGIVASRAD